MAKVIDIDVIFDTQTIEKKYGPGGTATHPKGIAHEDVFMITRAAIVENNSQATADLTFKALVNDSIRWRSESLDGNSDQSVIIYKIVKFSGTQVTNEPEMRISYPTTPIPCASNPTSYNAVNSQADVFLTCDVLEKGTEGYQVWFYIVNKDPDTGALSTYGYYCWDPTIHVVG